MKTRPCANLFVYGTLRHDAGNDVARLLAENATFVGPAKIRGRLYAVNSYPGMVPSSNPHDWVTGDVYRLQSPEKMLRELDDYEGCGPADIPPHEFERVLAEAFLESGTPISCWVYVYRRRPTEHKRIVSGDYLAELRRKAP